MTSDKGEIDLGGKSVSDDPVVQRVIAAEARAKEIGRLAAALKKDRDQLLDEFTDLRNARPVPRNPSRKDTSEKADSVRVILGDVHGMMMDRPAVDAALADIKALAPDEIVLMGDIMECGGWLAKHQTVGFIASCDYTYQEDCQAANWFLDSLQAAAPEAVIHYVEGNHEDRVERWVVDQVAANKRDGEFLLAAFGPRAQLRVEDRGINWYGRHDVHIPGYPRGWMKIGKMHFTHQLGNSKNAARDAAQRTGGNVTYGDTHREDSATLVLPAIGVIKAFNVGCLCTRQPVWKHSDPTSWSHGYGIDLIAKSGNFQRVHVPIWDGKTLAGAMITRFKS